MKQQVSSHARQLSRTIMILAIPLFILILGTFFRHSNRLLHDEAIERNTTILNITIQLVSNHLTTIQTAARSNVWMVENHFTPDSLLYVSRRIVSLNKNVLSCSISAEPNFFPEHGEYFSAYSVNEGDTVVSVVESEFNYFEKNWYKKPMLEGKPCWINPFSDFNSGTINHHAAVGSYCIPLRVKGGRVVGVLSADFSFQKLREAILATHHPYPNSYFMLLGPAGGYLVHPNTELLFKKSIFNANDSTEHPDIIALGKKMTAGEHGTMHVVLDKEECHVCYAPVPHTGWSIALVCLEDDVLADYRHLEIILAALVIFGLIIIWWITRKVVQQNIIPINNLLEATKKIADGNYDVEIPLSDRKDTVSQLQNAFREMHLSILEEKENIKRTTEEISKEKEELERAMPISKEAARRRNHFIHNVNHRITSPLNTIESLANFAFAYLSANSRQKKLNDEEMKTIANTMKNNANILLRLTLMMYDSSDTGIADTDKYRRTDIVACNEEARQCISQAKQLYSIEDVAFQTELPDTVTIQTSQLFLTRTILELLYNADRFSDRQHILLSISQTETAVRFVIQDQGPGIPEQLQELMYEPFNKDDDLSEGLGLGLPLCKRHITAMEGQLIYDKDYQQGCRFIIELPK